MTANRKTSEDKSEFTAADRDLLIKTAQGVDAIKGFLFGDAESDRTSLVVKIERNTMFRKAATIVLTLLLAAFFSGLGYIIFH